jgi:tRNA A37 threonylcarbamoyltransferase TsaD
VGRVESSEEERKEIMVLGGVGANKALELTQMSHKIITIEG